MPPQFFPEEIQWNNYTRVFSTLPFLSQLWTSVPITVLRTGAQLVLCSMAGYAFARMRFKGRGLLFRLLLAILMIPNMFAVAITTVLWSWNDLLWPLITP